MRILVLSDIHANLTALEAVLTAAGDVDAVWSLGDLVGYGPDPNECIERLRSLPNLTAVMGNHDAAVVGQIELSAFNREARSSILWTKKNLKPENWQFLESLPEKVVVEKTTLAHGSPRSPIWEYLLDTYTAAENFSEFDTPLCFVGHTHMPVAFYWQPGEPGAAFQVLYHRSTPESDQRAIVNPGSVGQPRDHAPRAAYAIFWPELHTWQTFRVEYEFASVQKRILNSSLPERHALRLTGGW